jgi:hypothetical protein
VKPIKTALLAVGVIALLSGLVWMGQGSGYFPYPASSFMIDQTVWIYRGLAMAVAGVVLIGLSRRV